MLSLANTIENQGFFSFLFLKKEKATLNSMFSEHFTFRKEHKNCTICQGELKTKKNEVK